MATRSLVLACLMLAFSGCAALGTSPQASCLYDDADADQVGLWGQVTENEQGITTDTGISGVAITIDYRMNGESRDSPSTKWEPFRQESQAHTMTDANGCYNVVSRALQPPNAKEVRFVDYHASANAEVLGYRDVDDWICGDQKAGQETKCNFSMARNAD